jgi:hypothetical protein
MKFATDPALPVTLPLKLAHRTVADFCLAAEALLLLTLFRACLTLFPVRHIVGAITANRSATVNASATAMQEATAIDRALRVRWAIEAVTRNSIARFVCLPQALAGYTMLRLRRIPGTMVFGVARSPAGQLIAHTWLLTLGERIVLGGNGSAAFTPVSRWA